jgi:hypothetical protein
MRNDFSKPREPNNENWTGCPQRYGIFGYERKGKDLLCTANNKVLEIILREYNFDFHQRNRDIQISVFSNSLIIKLGHFNHF